MKSVRSKLILNITLLMLTSLIIVISISLTKSSHTTTEVANYEYQEKIQATTNILKMNLYQTFNTVNAKDGNLIDPNGNVIDVNGYLDKFSKTMKVKNSIYVKDGSDFKRTATTLKDSNGKRLVGITLDSTSAIYKAISDGKSYFGYTTINGKEYLTEYQPMYSTDKDSGEIIGAFSTLEATSEINSMISSNQMKTATILILTSVIIFAIAIVQIYFISSSIAKPVKEASYMAKELKLGHFNYRLKSKSKDEIGQMSRDMDDLADDLQNVVLAGMKKISVGDVNIELTPKDEKDELTPTLSEMVNSIRELVDETKKLEIEAENGNLNARGDVNKFKGEYIHIVNAINGTLKSVVTPMQEVITVMGQLCEGKLDVSVNGDYKGDYAVLKNSVNQMIQLLGYVIKEIGTLATRISNSDLNIDEVRNYMGDFNSISIAFNKLVDNLNGTMKEINAAAVQVAAGSGQIADTSVMLSQGSEEQASSIEQVTSAITQMAAQVEENAENSSKADALSKSAKESALNGDEQMQKMLVAMQEINESSSNISKIIKVIDDIAFQTNILALNAAVEAARAGQYGKGFAVVAEEVRNLAQKSAAAAKETTAMIENSIDKVKLGTEIANSTEQALKEIVGSITKTSELVSNIAVASNEQASAITQVSGSIEQVSGVVQTNSATAEETASASEELTSQAEMLKNMVKKFKLKSGTQMQDTQSLNSVSSDLQNTLVELLKNKGVPGEHEINQETAKQKNNIKIDFDGEF